MEPGTKRIWILNRILDKNLLATLKSRLEAANEMYIDLGIDWNHYVASVSRTDRITTLIGINQARNEGFKHGAQIADFVFILDGDCFFDESTWNIAASAITRDQIDHTDRKYYALPLARVFLEDGPIFDINDVELEEPILTMRKDAEILFDESAVFGKDDKALLLLKLGLRNQHNHWYALNSEGPCLVVGRILHLCTSTRQIELDNWSRHILRRESLNLILARSDEIAARHTFTSSVTRAIWFKACCLLLSMIETTSFAAQRLWFEVKFALRKLWLGT